MIGITGYRNIWLAQVPSTLSFLHKVIQENNFKYIIEIGTNRGGLSLWINDNKQKDCQFMTLDIDPNVIQFNPQLEKIDFQVGDCFGSHFDMIKKIITENGQILLLCDGGDKNLEFNIFAKFLKPNDIIMCHDYMDDLKTFKKVQEKYNWKCSAESFYSEIKETVESCGLIPYLYEEGKDCIWGSFKKM